MNLKHTPTTINKFAVQSESIEKFAGSSMEPQRANL